MDGAADHVFDEADAAETLKSWTWRCQSSLGADRCQNEIEIYRDFIASSSLLFLDDPGLTVYNHILKTTFIKNMTGRNEEGAKHLY